MVAARHNERGATADPTAHAEMLVLRDTAAAIGNWRLSDVTIVVTLEPCAMCAGALVAARVGRLVYGASDPRAGACGTLYNLCVDPRLNHELTMTDGVRATECGALLTSFFTAKRGSATRGVRANREVSRRADPETPAAGQAWTDPVAVAGRCATDRGTHQAADLDVAPLNRSARPTRPRGTMRVWTTPA